jgi:hypothetical protein
MKIVQGLTFKFNHVIDISHFQAVQVLQVRIIKIVVVLGCDWLACGHMTIHECNE